MSDYSANARSWFGPGWTTWVRVGGGAEPIKDQGADRAFPNGQYGIMIPQIYGRGRVPGNIIWYGEAVAVEPEVEGGEVTYVGTFAVGICRGPIDSILRIWADDLLIYDAAAGGASDVVGALTVYLGDEAQTPDPVMEGFEGAGNVPGYRGLAYVVFEGMALGDFGNRIPSFSFEVQAQTSASVESVLDAMAEQVGLETDDYDFGCIDQTVTGYIITQRAPAKSHIDQLLGIFAADLTEIAGQVRVVQRGGDALATIAAADLGAKLWTGAESNPAPPIVAKRMQDVELPFRLDLNYFSANKGYDPTTTFAVRYDKPDVQNQVTVESGLVLTEDQARAIAERMLYQQWIERTSFDFALMPAYLRYVPGAVLYLPVDGELIRVRVVQMDLGLFGPIGVSAVLDDIGILTQTIPGAVVETETFGLAGAPRYDFSEPGNSMYVPMVF